MKLLLDTPVVLWWLDDPNLITEDAVDAISEPKNQVLVSAAVGHWPCSHPQPVSMPKRPYCSMVRT